MPIHTSDIELFQEFTRPMMGLPLSHFWFGFGSAIFLEFGRLNQNGIKPGDGSEGNPHGEFGAMITWGWRLEGRRYILCGSWSDDDRWQPAFQRLAGTTLTQASVFAHLPEIELTFSNDIRCQSFMIDKGDPQWALFDRRLDNQQTLHVQKGRLQIEWPSRPLSAD